MAEDTLSSKPKKTVSETFEFRTGTQKGSPSKEPQTQLPPQGHQANSSDISSACVDDLYHLTVRKLAGLYVLIECNTCLQEHTEVSLERQLSFLYVWAQGLDPELLQTNLDHLTQLQATVVKALLGILESVKVISNGRNCNSSDEQSVLFVKRCLQKIAEAECESDSSSSDSNDTEDDATGSGRETSLKYDHRHHATSLKRLKMHVRCLMDLLPTFVHLCNEGKVSTDDQEAAGSITQSQGLDIIQPYIIQVQDKFPSIDKALATRLGEANWNRFNRLQGLAAANRALQEDLDELYSEGNPAATFCPSSKCQDSGLGASLMTRPRSIPSVISHTSCISTDSAATRVAARVPPTPAEVDRGDPFECYICGLIQCGIRNRIGWKMHVYADIQPYICTSADCTGSIPTFPTKASWAKHEFRYHRSHEVWRCFECGIDTNSEDTLLIHWIATHEHEVTKIKSTKEAALRAAKTTVVSMSEQKCPMCTKTLFQTQREWTTHVGKHMEDIVLIVLPRVINLEDDRDDRSNTASDASDSISAEPECVNLESNYLRPVDELDKFKLIDDEKDSTHYPTYFNSKQNDENLEDDNPPPKLFACPFYKFELEHVSPNNDTTNAPSTCGKTLRNISELKRHLHKLHFAPEFFCPRCFRGFQLLSQLTSHVRNENACTITDCPFTEMIYKAQQPEVLFTMGQCYDAEKVWFDIYKVIFPQVPLPSSPYV